jgi:hypothetical protein
VATNLSRPKVGRDHALPDVEAAATEAAAVDDEDLTARQLEDGRVALPDVQESHSEA